VTIFAALLQDISYYLLFITYLHTLPLFSSPSTLNIIRIWS